MKNNQCQAKIDLIFDCNIDSEENLKKIVRKAYQVNKNFFNKDVFVKINFLYERQEMDKIHGYKTKSWQVGYANNNRIYIFSPLVFDKLSDHPLSDFSYILTHEIAHIFTNKIFNFSYPKWLKEGLAGYIAEQYKIRPVYKINNFSKLHNKEDWDKFFNYSQAFSFTKYLIDKFGEDKMLGFLKNLSKKLKLNHRYEEFVDLFNDYFKTVFCDEVSIWAGSIKLSTNITLKNSIKEKS